MNDSELEAVLAHEIGHVKNYDIRVTMIAFANIGHLLNCRFFCAPPGSEAMIARITAPSLICHDYCGRVSCTVGSYHDSAGNL